MREKDGTSSSSSSFSGAVSPPESVDSQQSVQGLDGGYDAFMEKIKSNSVSYVFRIRVLII